MPHVSNLNQSSTQVMCDLINYNNDTTFTPTHLNFTLAQAGDVGDVGYNSKVLVRGITGSGFRNQVTVKYNRLDIHTLHPTSVPTPRNGAVSHWDLIPVINAALGIQLTVSDVVDQLIVWGGEVTSVVVVIKDSSVLYTGTITVDVSRVLANINSVWAIRTLPGFTG